MNRSDVIGRNVEHALVRAERVARRIERVFVNATDLEQVSDFRLGVGALVDCAFVELDQLAIFSRGLVNARQSFEARREAR